VLLIHLSLILQNYSTPSTPDLVNPRPIWVSKGYSVLDFVSLPKEPWWVFTYCSQDIQLCALVLCWQRDEGTSLRLDDIPQPFDFFHWPDGHDQVDVALAQAPEERMAHVKGLSPRPIQSRDKHFIADEPNGLLPQKIHLVAGAEDRDDPVAGATQVFGQWCDGPDATGHPQAENRPIVTDGEGFINRCGCLFLTMPEPLRSRYLYRNRLGQLA